MQMVILAAGLGKRLAPLTNRRSKAMMPVAGKPMVGRLLDQLIGGGLTDLFVIVASEDTQIRDYLHQKKPPGTSMRLLIQERRDGTASALKLAMPFLKGNFLVSACDSLTPVDHLERLLAAHKGSGNDATLSLMKIRARETPSSTVKLEDDRVVVLIEKPRPGQLLSRVTCLPLYVFSPCLLAHLAEVGRSPRGEFELTEAIQRLIDQGGQVKGILAHSRMQLTTPDDLLELNRHFLRISRPPLTVATKTIGKGTKLLPPLLIEPGTRIGSHSIIGPNVYIEEGCQIGDQVHLQDAVLLKGSKIGTGERVSTTVVGG